MTDKSIARHTAGELEVRFGDHLTPVAHADRPIGGSGDYCENAANYAHVICIAQETRGIQFSKKVAAANAARIALTWNCHDDLLEALKKCAGVCAGATLSKSSLTDALEAANAAIAKATGVRP